VAAGDQEEVWRMEAAGGIPRHRASHTPIGSD
jgi:hypothetical protein